MTSEVPRRSPLGGRSLGEVSLAKAGAWRTLMFKGRLACTLILSFMLLSVLASAQTEVRIARPVDGATVRETVNVLVPASGIPEGGFITCMVDGQFKCADATKSEDRRYFVYRWNTKAIERSPETGVEQPRPKDGKHDIAIQVYDHTGKKVGNEQQVSVFVKNSAAADMPAEGLKLRYASDRGAITKYRCKYSIDLKSIQGATNITGALGEAIEGAQATVKRSVEDVMPDGTILVRQKLEGAFLNFTAGQPIAADIVPKAFYAVEDTLGRMTYVMMSSSPGVAVSLDMPNLPSQKVRIGDSWGLTEKVFRNLATGESVAISATSVLEGLEWEGGHPCARIKTRFAGTVGLPFSSLITQAIPIMAETTTYFAYRVGKVVLSTTRAVSEPALPQSMVNNLTQALVSKSTNAIPGSSPIGMMGSQGSMFQGPEGSKEEQTVKVKLEVNESIELVQ